MVCEFCMGVGGLKFRGCQISEFFIAPVMDELVFRERYKDGVLLAVNIFR